MAALGNNASDAGVLIVLLALVLIFFGPRQLPRLGRWLREAAPPGSPAPAPVAEAPDFDRLLVHVAAHLCHPDNSVRELCVLHLLRMFPALEFPSLEAVVSRPASRVLLTAVLGARQVTTPQAAAVLIDRVRDKQANSLSRVAAVRALRTLQCAEAAPALLELLCVNNEAPSLYVSVVEALAEFRSPEIVPVLAALAVDVDTPSRAAVPALPERCGDRDFSLLALIRAHEYLHENTHSRRMRDAIGESGDTIGHLVPAGAAAGDAELSRALSERRSEIAFAQLRQAMDGAAPGGAPDDGAAFARDALWELGEAGALNGMRDVCHGNPARVVEMRDPRLFEALALVLLHHPSDADERAANRAAIEGLEALGSDRALSLLEGHGRGWWPLGDFGLRRESRLAAARLRAAGRGTHEPVPAGGASGTGSEGTGAPPS